MGTFHAKRSINAFTAVASNRRRLTQRVSGGKLLIRVTFVSLTQTTAGIVTSVAAGAVYRKSTLQELKQR